MDAQQQHDRSLVRKLNKLNLAGSRQRLEALLKAMKYLGTASGTIEVEVCFYDDAEKTKLLPSIADLSTALPLRENAGHPLPIGTGAIWVRTLPARSGGATGCGGGA